MSRVVIVHSSLRNSCQYVAPFVSKLYVFLNKKFDVEIKSAFGLNAESLSDYDIIIFAFMNSVGAIPSSTLSIFEDLSKIKHKVQTVYTLICNDEMEIEACDYSEGIVEIFCKQNGYNYMGSLKIGACLIINHLQYGFVLTNYIKKFASCVISNKEAQYSYTYITRKRFISDCDKYWSKCVKEAK